MEVDTVPQHRRDEHKVTSKAVQACHHEGRTDHLAPRQRSRQLRPIAVLAALDLNERFDDAPLARPSECPDGGPLGFQSKATLALPLGGNSEVCNYRGHCFCLSFFVE